ncbi:MAG: hydroxyacid dehydrogenase [Propionibacteriales bacterium]|nr:hydroxyacid dehydrogenase [Propionibacteriales bacterium]
MPDTTQDGMQPRRRLAVLCAMSDHVRDELLTPDLHDRLEACVDVLDTRVTSSFEDPTVRSALGDADILLTGWGCPPVTGDVLDHAPRLRALVHSAGTVKTFVSPEVIARIDVSTGAHINAFPVAEYTVAMIVLGAKRVFALAHQLRTTGVHRDLDAVPPLGLRGITVGVLSASMVGRLVIERLRGHAVRILCHDPTVDDAELRALGAEPVSLVELFARSQVLTIHAPLLPQTYRLVDAHLLARLPDHAVVINTARGAIIDTAALTAECRTGRLDAVLDVTHPEPLPQDHPLLHLPNVLVTPHIAGALGNEIGALGESAVAEIERLAAGQPMVHVITSAQLVTSA